jgi:hypothetical protein
MTSAGHATNTPMMTPIPKPASLSFHPPLSFASSCGLPKTKLGYIQHAARKTYTTASHAMPLAACLAASPNATTTETAASVMVLAAARAPKTPFYCPGPAPATEESAQSSTVASASVE